MKSIVRNFLNFIKYFFNSDIILESNVRVYGSNFEGKNKVYSGSVFVNGKCGKGTYIGKNCHFSRAVIGRYCSIGNRVRVILSNHPSSKFVSTHPAFFSTLKQAGFTYSKKQTFDEFRYINKKENIAAFIGHDVWIGDDVTIMGGVKINHGAIIGAKALITKDVAPFSIVGGVPAKLIGKRFSDEEIEFLEQFKWWEKDENWISKNAYLFSDIKQFMKQFKI
ncbi:CatB-related O-acetyltransferase [Lutimonas halocynthiae]|nr:CatB-related O-acetyltransferase [Lutimonas halocynthiae]MDN3643787.1 CatB-related O-acetyltransferase [Lutimonas halocynthiae]